MGCSLCAGIEACAQLEVPTHRQRKLERVRGRQNSEEVEASEEEEESGGVADVVGNLTIEMAGTEEEAAENLEVALGMEIEEAGVDVVKGK